MICHILCCKSEPPTCLNNTVYFDTSYQIQPLFLEWNNRLSGILANYHLLTDINEDRRLYFKQTVSIHNRKKSKF